MIFQSRWCSSIIGHKFGTTIAVRAEESRAVGELGIRNLRRLQYHDPTAPGWRVIGRLLRPLEAVNAGLDSPPTAHRRRALEDAIAVLLARCAEVGQTFWGWSTEEWIHLLGRDQGRVLPGTRPVGPATRSAPISPRTPICSVPSPSSTSSAASNDSLCRIRIFGRDRVSGEIGRVRKVLAEWGYRLGHGDDTLLPMATCQLFLLNRSPHVEDLGTELLRSCSP